MGSQTKDSGIEIIIEPDVVPLGKVDARLFPVYFERIKREQRAAWEERAAAARTPAPEHEQASEAPAAAAPVAAAAAPGSTADELLGQIAAAEDLLAGQDIVLELDDDELALNAADEVSLDTDPELPPTAGPIVASPVSSRTVAVAAAAAPAENPAPVLVATSPGGEWYGSSDEIPELSVNKSLRSGFSQLAKITLLLLMLGLAGYFVAVEFSKANETPVLTGDAGHLPTIGIDQPETPAQPAPESVPVPEPEPVAVPAPEPAVEPAPAFEVSGQSLSWEEAIEAPLSPTGSAAVSALQRPPLAPQVSNAAAVTDAAIELVDSYGPAAFEPELDRSLIQSLLERATTAELSGDFDLAIEHYREILALSPHEPGIAFRIGVAYHQLGNPERARESYEQALGENPRDLRAQNNLGLLEMAAGRLDSAEERFWNALMVDPNYAPALTNLGHVAEARDELGAALGYYRQALEADPQRAEARYNLAKLLATGGDLGEAQRHVELLTSSSQSPYQAWGYDLLGKIHARRGELDKAIAAYTAALAIDPEFIEARNDLGIAYLAQRDYARARTQFDSILAIHPDFPKGWNNLGVALVGLGRLWTAQDAYLKAIELMPGFADAHFNYGVLMERLGEVREALRAYDRTLKVDDHYFAALNNLGVMLMGNAENTDDLSARERRLQESLGYFDRAISISPLSCESTINKGKVLTLLGRREEARQLWQAFVEADPETEGAARVREFLERGIGASGSTIDSQYSWN